MTDCQGKPVAIFRVEGHFYAIQNTARTAAARLGKGCEGRW